MGFTFFVCMIAFEWRDSYWIGFPNFPSFCAFVFSNFVCSSQTKQSSYFQSCFFYCQTLFKLSVSPFFLIFNFFKIIFTAYAQISILAAQPCSSENSLYVSLLGSKNLVNFFLNIPFFVFLACYLWCYQLSYMKKFVKIVYLSVLGL